MKIVYIKKQASQRGVALLIGLILLLVLSVLGLAAIRNTSQQTMMAAGNQQQTLTFHAAEAAIHLIMAELAGDQTGVVTPANGGMQLLVTAITNGKNPAASAVPVRKPAFDSSSGLSAAAGIKWTGTTLVEGGSIGKFGMYQFNLDSNATQAGTNAIDHHQQGIGFIGPKAGDR